MRDSPTESILHVEDVNILEPTWECGDLSAATHGHQPYTCARAQVVRPDSSPLPGLAIVARIGRIELIARPAVFNDPQPAQLVSRSHNAASIPWVARWHRIYLFGKLKLSCIPD